MVQLYTTIPNIANFNLYNKRQSAVDQINNPIFHNIQEFKHSIIQNYFFS